MCLIAFSFRKYKIESIKLDPGKSPKGQGEKVKNKLVFVALLLAVNFGNLWAQGLPAGIWTSPQNIATEGRFRSDADDFIRVDAFTNLSLNNWFGMVSFLQDAQNRAIATGGFATNARNIYFAVFYSGNFWANAPTNNPIERQFGSDNAPAGGQPGVTYRVFGSINVAPDPVNNVALLIGFADMGFRLTYRTNYQSFRDSNIVVANQLYRNFSAGHGYLAPQIAWGMARNLTRNGIRPYVTLDLVLNRHFSRMETVGPNADGNTGERVERSSNFIAPQLAVGLGGLTVFSNDAGFSGSVDFDYELALRIYNNEFSYLVGNTLRIGQISGTNNPGTFPLVERSYMSNRFIPAVSGSWRQDRIALGFRFNLPVTITNESSAIMGLNPSNVLINAGASDTRDTLAIQPDLRLGLQYVLVPDRFTLNAGARIQTTAISLARISREVYNEGGSMVHSERIHLDSYGGTFVSNFHVGLNFNFLENIWVEATTGVSNAFGNEQAIDIFMPGGLFSFGRIMVGLRF